MVVDSKSVLCTSFTYKIDLSVKTFIASYQVHHLRFIWIYTYVDFEIYIYN